MAPFDGIVVGAGIIGAACARELALARLRVAVCDESDVIAGGATAAAMGHLAVMDDSEAQFALTSYSQTLWRDLATERSGGRGVSDLRFSRDCGGCATILPMIVSPPFQTREWNSKMECVSIRALRLRHGRLRGPSVRTRRRISLPLE